MWRYNWRFFLPHGVAMTKHYTVQLLHFPPDTVLMVQQNYLAAATTERWAELLEENGAAKTDVERFQNIIDIAPIAAPHKDGEKLSGDKSCKKCKGVYPHFNDYIKALLELWLPLPAPGRSRPLVAFGGPVRDWLKSTYHVGLKVPEFGVVTLILRVESRRARSQPPEFHLGCGTIREGQSLYPPRRTAGSGDEDHAARSRCRVLASDNDFFRKRDRSESHTLRL